MPGAYMILSVLGWLVGVSVARWLRQRRLWPRHREGALGVLRDEFIVWTPFAPAFALGVLIWRRAVGQSFGLAPVQLASVAALLGVLSVALWIAPPVTAARGRLSQMRG